MIYIYDLFSYVSRLRATTMSDLIQIALNSEDIKDFNPDPAISLWDPTGTKRKPRKETLSLDAMVDQVDLDQDQDQEDRQQQQQPEPLPELEAPSADSDLAGLDPFDDEDEGLESDFSNESCSDADDDDLVY